MKELSPYSLQRPSPLSGEETTILNQLTVEVDEKTDLRDYWWVIRKHVWLITVVFLGVTSAGTLRVMTKTPIYTAEATLLVERQAPQVLNIRGVLPETQIWGDWDYYKTQYEILRRRSLAAQVIREQGLEKNLFFTGQEGERGLVTELWSKVRAWEGVTHEQDGRNPSLPPKPNGDGEESLEDMFEEKGGSPHPAPKPNGDGEKSLGVESRLINTYLAMLNILPVRDTSLVRVAFSTPEPKLSARLANAHAAAYIRQGLELRTQTSGEAEQFLEEKLVELKERLEKSEAALNRYRRDKQIISLDDKENLVVERLSDLNNRLTQAEAERIALEAQVHLIRKRDYNALPAVINSALISTLKGQLATLEGQYAQLAVQFKPGYPFLTQLQAQVEDTRRRVEREIENVIEGVESIYLTAVAHEKELRVKMEEQKTTTLGLKDVSVGYAILAREVDTNRQLYDSVLQRMKEMEMVAEIRASNVSVIDPAEVPQASSSPNKKRGVLFAALVGLMGGVGLAFFFEHLDNTLRTPEQVEHYLRLPSLGTVPDFSSLNGHSRDYTPERIGSKTTKASRPALEKNTLEGNKQKSSLPSRPHSKELILAQHPRSIVAEAYHALRTAILFARAGEPPRVILFTSGTMAEGKTVTTINTAVIFAQMGSRVVVIDADLRHRRCHEILGTGNGVGLTELLTGQRELAEVLKPTPTGGLFFISAGATPPSPAELLGSQKMADTITTLQGDFDYILIDSPPVMPVNDAVLLSTMVDGVVVVGGSETPKQVIRQACLRLRAVRAKILGVVLNRVNIRNGDYAYYYYSYYPDTMGTR
jgi:capsular exopolysaccharide synthesis family protein